MNPPKVYNLAVVGSFADHRHVGLTADNRSQSFAHHHVVIGAGTSKPSRPWYAVLYLQVLIAIGFGVLLGIRTLNRDKLIVRAAHARTGIATADFSRIRNADLARFTVDRLVGSLTGSDRVLKSN